jgi:hypothetical protein
MKLDFGKKAMDIGTPSSNFVRTLMIARTGGLNSMNASLLPKGSGRMPLFASPA